MKKRFITATFITVIFIAVAVLSLIVQNWFFDIFVLLLMFFGVLEIANALRHKFARPLRIFLILNVALGYAAFALANSYWTGSGKSGYGGGITAFFGVLALLFLACIVYNMFSKRNSIKNVISTMFGMIYPTVLLFYMLSLNYFAEPYRSISIVLLFVVSPFSDVMAYLVGSTLKGPKLCPTVSPNKTVSGAIGGLFGGLLGGAFLILLTLSPLSNIFNLNMLSSSVSLHILHCLMLGLGGSAATQLGDLIASYIKRQCGIKDFDHILPGHGGVLDRIDGMMLNGLFIFVYMTLLSIL